MIIMDGCLLLFIDITSCTITETVKVGWNFMFQFEITETRTYTAEKSVCGYGSGWCLTSAGC